MKIVAALRILRRVQVLLHHLELLGIVFARRVVACPWDDANDRHRRRLMLLRLVIIDMQADRILPGEEFLRERLVDNDRARVAFFSRQIFRSETAPAQYRHSHYLEVIG